MVEEHVFDLLPGYALGVLDEADLFLVARHLPKCARCRAELAAYNETVDLLAQVVPAKATAPDLRARVVGRVMERSRAAGQPVAGHLTAAGYSASAEAADGAGRPTFADLLRGMLPRRARWAVAGLALLLILFLGLSNLLLWQQVQEMQTRLPAENMQLVRLTGTENAPDATGYIMVFKDDNYGALAVDDVPVLDPDHQYQVWLIRDGQRTSGGVFSVNESGYGTLEIASDQPLDSFQSFGITVEPRGGSPGPTGERILGGDL